MIKDVTTQFKIQAAFAVVFVLVLALAAVSFYAIDEARRQRPRDFSKEKLPDNSLLWNIRQCGPPSRQRGGADEGLARQGRQGRRRRSGLRVR